MATEEDNIIPDIRINANNPPIKPPFSLNKLVFKRSISKKKTVPFKLAIFKKVNGDNGLSDIFLKDNTYTIKIKMSNR